MLYFGVYEKVNFNWKAKLEVDEWDFTCNIANSKSRRGSKTIIYAIM